MSVILPYLIVAYGLCFGLQNKVPFLYDKVGILDRMLQCTYCTGFHTGWMVYLLHVAVSGFGDLLWWQHVLLAAAWGFASSGFCYGVDAVVEYLEAYVTAVKANMRG